MDLDDIFREVCELNMIGFDLDEFKSTHPNLYGCIIGSMLSAYSIGLKTGKGDSNFISEGSLEDRMSEGN
jgi:hypothetical protein